MSTALKMIATISNTNSQNKPPIINHGDVTPELCYQIEKAFKGFFAHKGIKADEQVPRCLYSFQDHWIEEWIATHSNELVLLSFADFMLKFRSLVLVKGWQGKLKTSILGMRQEDRRFNEFYNLLDSRNILLRGSSSHLDQAKVRETLESSMTKELSGRVEYEKVDQITVFEDWIAEVRRVDDYMFTKREERARIPRRAALAEPSRNANTSSSSAPATASSSSSAPKAEYREGDRPKKMTQEERDLLAANGGCFKCRRLFVYHMSGDCINRYPTTRFTVDQRYIDTFKSKAKPVAAVSRGRERERDETRLSGDHRERCSASPRIANARPRRSSSCHNSDLYTAPLSSRLTHGRRSPSPRRRSPSIEQIATDGVRTSNS